MTKDIHAVGPKGRTETMIPLIRETFGDKMALYADANGFYSVDEAIRVGKLLKEYRYGFFEHGMHRPNDIPEQNVLWPQHPGLKAQLFVSHRLRQEHWS